MGEGEEEDDGVWGVRRGGGGEEGDGVREGKGTHICFTILLSSSFPFPHLFFSSFHCPTPFSSIHHCIGVITPSFPPSPRQVTQSKRLAEEEASPQPHKDYSLKEGEKIRINLGVRAT